MDNKTTYQARAQQFKTILEHLNSVNRILGDVITDVHNSQGNDYLSLNLDTLLQQYTRIVEAQTQLTYTSTSVKYLADGNTF